ncbi:MAG: hypothetical protein HPY76_11730 [Anaerolineae bacterium]|nr:hypothetical protein [Anaerolineae bacterium]
MKTPPTIGVIGGSIWGNRGAESMLVTTIGMVRRKHPDAKFVVFSYLPKKDRTLITDKSIQVVSAKPASLVLRIFPFTVLLWFFNLFGIRLPDSLLTNVTRALRRCDLLLDISGVSFVDGREIFIAFNILTILPAMMLKIPVVKLAQALGPFKNPFNRAAARVYLPRCQHIFSRGDHTSQNLDSIGIKNYSRTADIAFLYQPEFSLSVENEEQTSTLLVELEQVKKTGGRLIAISPSSLVYEKSSKKGDDYPGRLLNLARELSTPETHFLFLANSTREGSNKTRNNDLLVVERLMHRALISLSPDDFGKTHWANWDINTAGLRQMIARCDLLVTSRFHGMVSALSLGVPTLVIGWSHKYAETMADFEMERFASDFGDQKVSLVDLAQELLGNDQLIRKQLHEKLSHVQELSQTQFDYLETLIH